MFLVRFFSSEGMDLLPDAYLFQWPHFLYLGLCILTFFLLMKLPDHRHPLVRKIIVTTGCVLLLFFKYAGEIIFVSEWFRYGNAVSTFSHPLWDWRTVISFQVCGVNNVLLPLVVWFNWKPLKDFVYPASILGGTAVLLYPVGVLFGDPLVLTFPMLRTLVVHFLLVFLPLYLIKIGEFRLESRYWYRALIGCILMIAWSMYGNLFVDRSANNMYLMRNPFAGGPVPILNQLPDGWHTIPMITLVILGFLLVYFLVGRYQKKVGTVPKSGSRSSD
jgi:hypothetical protein